MPTNIGPQTSAYVISSQDFYVLERSDTIFSSVNGIDINPGASEADILLLGGVYADNIGLEVDVSNVDVVVGERAIIAANSNAIDFNATADGSSIINYGSVISYEGVGIRSAFNVSGEASVQNYGSIHGYSYGLSVASENALNVNHGIISGAVGVHFDDGESAFVNYGTIQSDVPSTTEAAGLDVAAIRLSGFANGMVVDNHGALLSFDVAVDDRNFNRSEIRNYGEIHGDLNMSGSDDVRNDGVITGDISLGTNSSSYRGSGTLIGNLTATFGSDTVRNDGLIEGDIDLGIGLNVYRGRGALDGSLTMGQSQDTVRNSGEIFGDVSLNDGANEYRGSGLVSGNLSFGDDIDTVRNNGIIEGDVLLQSGADVYSGRGTVDGFVFGGSGGDSLTGSENADRLSGGSNADTLRGKDGDDVLLGDNGSDELRGGRGDDVLDGGSHGDVLHAGAGDDTLTGGSGIDTFVFKRSAGDNLITDFENGVDTIDLGALGLRNGDFAGLVLPAIKKAGPNDVLIDLDPLGGSGSVLVEGLADTDVDLSDFTF